MNISTVARWIAIVGGAWCLASAFAMLKAPREWQWFAASVGAAFMFALTCKADNAEAPREGSPEDGR